MAVATVYWELEKLDEPLIAVPRSLFMKAVEAMVRAEDSGAVGLIHHARRYLEEGGRVIPEAMLISGTYLKKFEIDVIPSRVEFKLKEPM